MSQLIEGLLDRIDTMRRQEEKQYNRCSDYLNEAPRTPQMIDELCRTKMCEWCYQVVDYAMFRRETVAIAINLLDRFLSSGSKRSHETIASRKQYQLAAMTTLFMSIKLFEPCKIDTALLASLSRGCYEEADFVKMENDILFSLNWYLNCPTALSFLELFLSVIPKDGDRTSQMKEVVKTYSKYLIERSIEDYELSMKKPSDIALAAISISVKKLSAISPFHEEKDIVRLVYSIENCSHFDLNGSEIDYVVNRIQQLPNKTVELRKLDDSHTGLTSTDSFSMKSNHSACNSSPVCVSKRR